MRDRRSLFCTHRCECQNRCQPDCCSKKQVAIGDPIARTYQDARARDVFRYCGSTRGKLQCELPDQHGRGIVGRRRHRRGDIEWYDQATRVHVTIN